MPADSPTSIPQEVQSIKTKAAGPDLAAALKEAQDDWGKHAAKPADLQAFSQQLQASGTLPALALELGRETMQSGNQTSIDHQTVDTLRTTAASQHDDFHALLLGQLSADWDKNKEPNSGNLTMAQIDVDLKGAIQNRYPNPDAGQTGQTAAPAGPQFSRGIGRGEGPYQPIAASHPDWNPHQVLDAAHKVKAALGPDHVYRQGEQLRMNDDGSVTSRQPDRHTPGNYDDKTMNGGKKVAERTGDAAGNWTETRFGDDGKPTGTVTHKQDASGSYTETTADASGKKTSERAADGKGNWTDTTFGADDNATGTVEHKQTAADGSFTETSKDASGKVTQTVEHKVNADHTTDDTTTDASGNKTQVVHTNADQSTVKTVYDPQHPGDFTETHAGADGKPTGAVQFTNNADQSTDRVEKGPNGTTTKTVHTNPDKSTVTTVADPAHPGVMNETTANKDGTVTGNATITTNADQSTDRVEVGSDGKPIKSVHTNPDQSTDTIEYANGQPKKETVVNADHSQTVKTFDPNNDGKIKFISMTDAPDGHHIGNEEVDADGSSHKWSVDEDGVNTTVNVDANGATTTEVADGDGKKKVTTIADKGGNVTSTVTVTHENGKTITVKQVPGQPDQRTEVADNAAPGGGQGT